MWEVVKKFADRRLTKQALRPDKRVDEAQKLGKAFHIEVDELGGVDGLAETSRETYSLRGPDERKRIALGPVPSMVDVLQLACQLHDSGRRREYVDSDLLDRQFFGCRQWPLAERCNRSRSPETSDHGNQRMEFVL